MRIVLKHTVVALILLFSCGISNGQSNNEPIESSSAGAKVKTIKPLTVTPKNDTWDDLSVIKGATRSFQSGDMSIVFEVSGEPNEKVQVTHSSNGKEVQGTGVSYVVEWNIRHKTKGNRQLPFSNIPSDNIISSSGNGLVYICAFKSVTAAADADLGEHIHEFTITVHYADY